MEPVLVPDDVLLHRDVYVRLINRYPRHIRECDVDKSFYILVVCRSVAIRRSSAGAIDEAIDCRRLIIHRVEDRFPGVVTPVEKVFRIIEPA